MLIQCNPSQVRVLKYLYIIFYLKHSIIFQERYQFLRIKKYTIFSTSQTTCISIVFGTVIDYKLNHYFLPEVALMCMWNMIVSYMYICWKYVRRRIIQMISIKCYPLSHPLYQCFGQPWFYDSLQLSKFIIYCLKLLYTKV